MSHYGLPTKRRAQQIGCGFTLVELLVVIGIIAVLIAILLPALSRARYQAQVVVCAARLQQLAQAVNIYANANKGFFPRQDIGGGTGLIARDVSHEFVAVFTDQYKMPKEMLFSPLGDLDAPREDWELFGYFKLIGYFYWVPRAAAGTVFPPADANSPGGFAIAPNVTPRGPIRSGEKLANATPIFSDVVYCIGTSDVVPDFRVSRLTGMPPLITAVAHFRKGRVDSSHRAYADGHVELVAGDDLRPVYYATNIWHWR